MSSLRGIEHEINELSYVLRREPSAHDQRFWERTVKILEDVHGVLSDMRTDIERLHRMQEANQQ